MARFRSSASKTRARRSQCPGPVGSGALQAGGLRKVVRLPWGPHRIPFTVTSRKVARPGPDRAHRSRLPESRATTCAAIATLRDMRIRRALIAAVAATLVLTGCGAAEKLSPQEAVREAAKATASQKEGSYKLSVVGSDDGLNAIFNEGAPLTEEDRKGLSLLRNGHIVLSTGHDKFGLDIKAGDLDHAFELRYVDKKLYARADVAGLAELFGGSSEEINQTVQALASQEGLEFIAAA